MIEKNAITKSTKEIFNERFKEGDAISRVVASIGIGLTILPGLSLTGFFFPFLAQLSIEIIYGIAAIGSLLVFCFAYPNRKYWYLGIIPGIFTGPLILFATIKYTYLRQEIFIGELIFPLVLGALPGWLLWYFPLRRRVVQDLEKEKAKNINS